MTARRVALYWATDLRMPHRTDVISAVPVTKWIVPVLLDPVRLPWAADANASPGDEPRASTQLSLRPRSRLERSAAPAPPNWAERRVEAVRCRHPEERSADVRRAFSWLSPPSGRSIGERPRGCLRAKVRQHSETATGMSAQSKDSIGFYKDTRSSSGNARLRAKTGQSAARRTSAFAGHPLVGPDPNAADSPAVLTDAPADRVRARLLRQQFGPWPITL